MQGTVLKILQNHLEQMSKKVEDIACGTAFLLLDLLKEHELCDLADFAGHMFEEDPVLLKLEGPIVIVGDLHGHLLDLYRIFRYYDLPPKTKYLFLGDIVDRGPFSLETLCLIYALKVSYPKHVYVVRGNHEFRQPTLVGGFYKDITELYSNKSRVYESFLRSFHYIPLAAVIGQILCLHGGISPDMVSLDQIAKIERPIVNYDTQILCGILWSDPSNEPTRFACSRRGTGFFFGKDPLVHFLNSNHLTNLIRGHECVDGAVQMFDGKVITVFSASSYCGGAQNESGTILITENKEIQPHLFPPLPFHKRSKATFVEPYSELSSGNPKKIEFPKKRISLALFHLTKHQKAYSDIPQRLQFLSCRYGFV